MWEGQKEAQGRRNRRTEREGKEERRRERRAHIH